MKKKKQKPMSFKIKVSNPEENRIVQEELFSRGYEWTGGRKRPTETDKKYLFFNKKDKEISYCAGLDYFNHSPDTEITVKQLLKDKLELIKAKKVTHIIASQGGTVIQICYSLKEMETFARELLVDNHVNEDTMRIYEIKSIIAPKVHIDYVKIQKEK